MTFAPVKFTLRLPTGLYEALKEQAETDGISLNQYINYALINHLAPGTLVRQTPEEKEQDRQAFLALRARLPDPDPEETARFLSQARAGEPTR